MKNKFKLYFYTAWLTLTIFVIIATIPLILMNVPIENNMAWFFRLALAFWFGHMAESYYKERKKIKRAIAGEQISKIVKDKYGVDVVISFQEKEEKEEENE